MARFFRLLALYAKMDVAWLLRDTKFALLAILGDVTVNLSMIAGIFLLAVRFGGVGGMSEDEVLLMLAYVTVTTGLFQTFFSNCNTGHISRRIGRGQFDHMMIQPLPIPVQLMTEGFIPFSGCSNLASGVVLGAVALHRLGLAPPWWWYLSLAGQAAVTLFIIVGLSYLASTLAFYLPVQAEEISSFVIDTTGEISAFPLSGMPGGARWTLVTVLPAGLLAWVPTLILLGKPPMGLGAWYPVAFCLILWTVALPVFKRGLTRYMRRGINRYVAFGHRR